MENTFQKSFDTVKAGNQRITVGLASNDDGNAIRKLVGFPDHINEQIDWNDIYPYWLIALNDETKVVGCVQVCLGKPVGRLEMLSLDESLTKVQKAKVTVRLTEQGFRTLKMHGVQYVSAVVPFEEKSYKKILKRRGGFVAMTGNLMAVNLWEE